MPGKDEKPQARQSSFLGGSQYGVHITPATPNYRMLWLQLSALRDLSRAAKLSQVIDATLFEYQTFHEARITASREDLCRLLHCSDEQLEKLYQYMHKLKGLQPVSGDNVSGRHRDEAGTQSIKDNKTRRAMRGFARYEAQALDIPLPAEESLREVDLLDFVLQWVYGTVEVKPEAELLHQPGTAYLVADKAHIAPLAERHLKGETRHIHELAKLNLTPVAEQGL